LKTLGVIGGLSWESSSHYYTRLNQLVAERLGGLHSAKLLLYSVDFDAVQKLQHADKWDELADMFVDIALRLEQAGAEGMLIGANTMHLLAPQVANALSIPFIHIGDATAAALKAAGVKTAALLGTRFTMEKPFYREHLERQGLKVLVPDEAERLELHRIIYDELCKGVVKPESKARFYGIIERLRGAGAGGVILGCTEFSMLADAAATPLPQFDTTELHARAAVDWMLN
jgi:amino-acid racemase